MAKKKTTKKPKRKKAKITGTKKVSKEEKASPPKPEPRSSLIYGLPMSGDMATDQGYLKHRIHRKILYMMMATSHIDCTHYEANEDTDEQYAYTMACEVIDHFSPLLVANGLTLIPIDTDLKADPRPSIRAYILNSKYLLTDVDTGYGITLAASAIGCNGQWSGNTAQTLAHKQVLLNTFMCGQKQPETQATKVRKQISVEVQKFNPEEAINMTKKQGDKELAEMFKESLKGPTTKKKTSKKKTTKK